MLTRRPPLSAVGLCLALLLGGVPWTRAEISSIRLTPLVRAVRGAAPSVVNIQGQKTVTDQNEATRREASREVNGMGTGIVVDPRGYILTNFHVVDGVRNIHVTLEDGQEFLAFLVSNDKETDLAIIKIRAGRQLPVIKTGTSSDLLCGETVVAVGNAYGYENTVTQGVISALHRDVQVSDTQAYEDLIQTDASINPGNSGGPLLNLDGEMIGVNVAVRAGAQGIGFAIPADKAMSVAAKLMSVEKLENKWHGMVTQASLRDRTLVVRDIQVNSPASKCGLRPGDTITRVGPLATARPLDVERALLGQPAGQPVPVEIQRGDEYLTLDLELASRVANRVVEVEPTINDPQTWSLLGMSLEPEPAGSFKNTSRKRYRGGMRIASIKPGSNAAGQGILPGDILVAIEGWETASQNDIDYIVQRGNLERLGSVKFYVLRGEQTYFVSFNVPSNGRTASMRR